MISAFSNNRCKLKVPMKVMFLLGAMMKQAISILQTAKKVMFVLIKGKQKSKITYIDNKQIARNI